MLMWDCSVSEPNEEQLQEDEGKTMEEILKAFAEKDDWGDETKKIVETELIKVVVPLWTLFLHLATSNLKSLCLVL